MSAYVHTIEGRSKSMQLESLCVKSIVGFTSLFLFQSVQSVATSPTGGSGVVAPFPEELLFRQANQLTLTTALVLAVVVLWRTLAKTRSEKDQIVVDMLQTMTTALASATASNIELRKVIEESVDSKRELSGVVSRLNDELKLRPCLIENGGEKPPNSVRHR